MAQVADSSTGKSPGRQRNRVGGDFQDLRVDLLQPPSRKYPGFKRDIFGPLFVRPKAVPPPQPPPPKKPVEPVVTEPPEVMEEVQEALARFTFLGFLVVEDTRTVFLAKGEEIFVVNKGDRFGENARFAVMDITPEELSIRQGDDPRLITIPLVEKEPLVPSF